VAHHNSWRSVLGILALLAGCASLPAGPSVLALPGTGKSFDEFRFDDSVCRNYALQQLGGMGANQAATDSAVRSAAIGTIVGAAAGAAMGGDRGAGVGAGTGLLFGSMAGAGAAQQSGYDTQRAYDHAYVQCMYAKGQRVPVIGDMSIRPAVITTRSVTTAPPSVLAPVLPQTTMTLPPPPPPGVPPPAPPGAVVR